jgi:hypothetical protein
MVVDDGKRGNRGEGFRPKNCGYADVRHEEDNGIAIHRQAHVGLGSTADSRFNTAPAGTA